MFIEHIPRAVMNVYRPGCASNRAAIAYTVFVYGHIQGVGVTAYTVYTGEVEPNVTNNRKLLEKTAETIATMPVKYIDREKTLFPSGHLKHEVSKCTVCPVPLRSRRGGANVMNSYEK